MKKLLLLATFALTSFISNAQHDMSKEKSKMPSPPAETKATLASGATLAINYHQPAVKDVMYGQATLLRTEKYGVQVQITLLLLKLARTLPLTEKP
jgi:hypothetical protein